MVVNEKHDDPVLAGMVDRLVAAFRPERIYLFGSKARRDDGADSDYDLMMLLREADEPGYRLSQRAHRALREFATAVDVLVWTSEALDSRLDMNASLPSTIVAKGRLLYERGTEAASGRPSLNNREGSIGASEPRASARAESAASTWLRIAHGNFAGETSKTPIPTQDRRIQAKRSSK